MASVGVVSYDVIPNLDGFAAKVASGLGKQKPVKISVEADTKSAEASAKRLTSIQTKEAQQSSRQRMALIQRDAIAENRFRDRSVAATKRASAQKMALIQRDAIAENRFRDRAAAVTERNAARQVAAQAKITASQQKAAAQQVAQQKAAKSQAAGEVGTGLLVGGAATIAALGGIAKVTADFDSAVSGVAATGKEARASISQLREAAIDYGASTKFSAIEAAEGQEELLKAGVSVADVMGGGLKGALDLAAAGNLGVGASAEAAATAVNQFNLKGQDFTHVADLMAQVAGTAQGEVSDVAQAFKNGGLTAAKFGLSIDETAQTLAVFAANGIIGAEAGTKLSSSLINLYAPLGQSKKALDKLGISTKDAEGNLLPIGDVLDKLKARLAGLDESAKKNALARIFGKENITAGLALVEQGSAGLVQAGKDFEQFGTAADVARVKMDNLRGDVEKLGGAFQSAFIEDGEGSTGGLRAITQGITGIVDAYSKLPDAGKLTAFIGAGVAASAAVGVGGILRLKSGIDSLKNSFDVLGGSSKRAIAAAGGIGIAITAATAVIGHFAIKQAEAKGRTDDLTQSLLASKGAIDGNVASTRAKSLEDQGALKAAQDLGITIEEITQASLGNASAQDVVNAKLAAYSQVSGGLSADLDKVQYGQDGVAKSARLVQDAIGGGNKELNAAIESYQRQAAAADAAAAGVGGVAASAKDANSAFRQSERDFANGATGAEKIGSAAGDAAAELGRLADKALAAANATLGLSGGAIAVEAAMDSAAAAAKRNGENLDISTAKGRDNQGELDRLVATTLSHTAAMDKQNRSVESVVAFNERAKSSYIKTAVAMGEEEKVARRTADALFALPSKVATQVVVSGAKVSASEAKSLNRELKGIPKEQRARIVTIANTKGAKEARTEIAKVKSKSVIAKATGKGVNTVREIDSALKKLKSKAVRAQAKAAGKPAVDALDKAIAGLESKKVTAKAKAEGEDGVRRLVGAVGALHNKSVRVNVHYSSTGSSKQAHNSGSGGGSPKGADGMFVPKRAGGGIIGGRGGPRSDNVMGIDPLTGRQTSWVSPEEFVTNAVSTATNRGIIEEINAKPRQKFGLVPLAGGGSPDGKASKAATSGHGGRPLIFNFDMGDLGIRRIVTEIVEDRDEYSASIGRM